MRRFTHNLNLQHRFQVSVTVDCETAVAACSYTNVPKVQLVLSDRVDLGSLVVPVEWCNSCMLSSYGQEF